MVWLAGTESSMPHREVIAAVADLVLSQQTGQTVAGHPLQTARLVREHARRKRSRLAVEDPHAAGGLPRFTTHRVDVSTTMTRSRATRPSRADHGWTASSRQC